MRYLFKTIKGNFWHEFYGENLEEQAIQMAADLSKLFGVSVVLNLGC